MDPLDSNAIDVPGAEVRVVRRCSSTNSVLLSENTAHAVLLAAEEQTAGRGRRGRRWYGTPGADVALSLRVLVRRPVREMPGLQIAAGVAAARALRALGAREAGLKWPNDLVARGAKLGGILVQTRSGRGATLAVIGVGINCHATPAGLRRPVISLDACVQPPLARNAVIERIGKELLAAVRSFEASGAAPFLRDWDSFDAGLRPRPAKAA